LQFDKLQKTIDALMIKVQSYDSNNNNYNNSNNNAFNNYNNNNNNNEYHYSRNSSTNNFINDDPDLKRKMTYESFVFKQDEERKENAFRRSLQTSESNNNHQIHQLQALQSYHVATNQIPVNNQVPLKIYSQKNLAPSNIMLLESVKYSAGTNVIAHDNNQGKDLIDSNDERLIQFDEQAVKRRRKKRRLGRMSDMVQSMSDKQINTLLKVLTKHRSIS